MEIREEIGSAYLQVKTKRPLIHHITNYVTVNDCANVVLSIGASPVMADESSEVEEMVSLASALVLNIGTCNSRTIESMILAGKAANKKNIPILLDPVGIGATKFRYESILKLLKEVKMSVIRGNMSEIKLLAGLQTKSCGVDSLDEDADGPKIAHNLAKSLNSVVAITGKTDFISNGTDTYSLNNGHINLTQVTGTGCMTSSLIGSFLGACDNILAASIAGISTMSIAGEKATKRMNSLDGIGSFKVYLIDEINKMTAETFTKEGKIEYVNIK